VVSRFAAGAFARHVVVHENALVGVDPAVPLELACLLACGVSTGWGAVVNRARVTPGESVVIWGCGGVGMAAVAGAAHAGASRVVAVDPLGWKTEQADLHGATHLVNASGSLEDTATEAYRAAGPHGADVAVVTVGALTSDLLSAAYRCLGVGGRLVTVSAGAPGPLQIAAGDLNVGEKTIMGSLMGSASPQRTITELSRLYRAGKLNLEAFVTTRYPLERINEACSDLLDGKNVRGVLTLQ
jgi:S-(hydroxymethyl)glutathione dehydrogenase/alcohol dehydrogenase